MSMYAIGDNSVSNQTLYCRYPLFLKTIIANKLSQVWSTLLLFYKKIKHT